MSNYYVLGISVEFVDDIGEVKKVVIAETELKDQEIKTADRLREYAFKKLVKQEKNKEIAHHKGL